MTDPSDKEIGRRFRAAVAFDWRREGLTVTEPRPGWLLRDGLQVALRYSACMPSPGGRRWFYGIGPKDFSPLLDEGSLLLVLPHPQGHRYALLSEEDTKALLASRKGSQRGDLKIEVRYKDQGKSFHVTGMNSLDLGATLQSFSVGALSHVGLSATMGIKETSVETAGDSDDEAVVEDEDGDDDVDADEQPPSRRSRKNAASTKAARKVPGDPSATTGLPLNLILYGPPGTGKTYRLTNELISRFRRAPTQTDSLAEIAEQLNWTEVTAISLHSLGGAAKVPVLADHPLIKAKYAAGHMRAPLQARLWRDLQTHTIDKSKTVNYTTRTGVRWFDKRTDSTWFLAEELTDDLLDVAERIAKPQSEGTLDDFTFVTFHQAFGYEDFIEGIRPNIEESADGEEAALSYRLEDGVFMKAVRSALRLAGYEGSVDEFCGLTTAERRAKFEGARHYALFIDEINRGNVARIFGELITLIEEDKRLGQANEVIVRLPYSKTRFGVPPNLHIIGTMNTADRSIEALDTALRRRFEFEELAPRPELLKFSIDGVVDAGQLLGAINGRLEKLYDRDHCIGHAYLLALAEQPTLDRLKQVFRAKFIPLLQEYFFGDWGKIGLVLGKSFVKRRDASTATFADFDHDDHDALSERAVWELADVSALTAADFQRIYMHVADD